jgi:ATP/maltotriose-dependent transcriptional regulator MalT
VPSTPACADPSGPRQGGEDIAEEGHQHAQSLAHDPPVVGDRDPDRALLAPSVTRRLLGQFARTLPGQRPTPASLSALTERETEVLRLLAAGLSNAELADRQPPEGGGLPAVTAGYLG